MRKKHKIKCFAITLAMIVSTMWVNTPMATKADDASVSSDEVTGDVIVVEEADSQNDGYELIEGNAVTPIDVIETEAYSDSTIGTSEVDLVGSSEETAPVTNNGTSVSFDYDDASRNLEVYIAPDGTSANLIFDYQLYNYDFATGQFTLEKEFPYAEYKFDVSQYYSGQKLMDTYIDEENGILYYGYNSYYNTYSGDEIANVIVYDLNTNQIINTFSLTGEILVSVGADKSGRIYIGTDNYYRDAETNETSTESGLIVLSAEGDVLVDKTLSYPINDFSGFCDDGTFYYIDEYMIYSAYGYPNLMGRLMNAKFADNDVTLNEVYMTYAKNLYFGDYRTPIEILNDKYLVTWDGGFYPLDKITDSSWSCALVASKDLEMGGEYDYLYNIGVNSVFIGDLVYSLYENNTIFAYDITTKNKVKYDSFDKKIVSLKGAGEELVALTYDGSNYTFVKLNTDDFDTVTVTDYNMNDFSVYKGRTKDDIVSNFVEAAPQDNSVSLYSVEGQTVAPYKEYTLSDVTKDNAIRISNYYRWLAGLTEFEASDDQIWSDGAKGAVLLAAVGMSKFSHNPAQPEDMDDAFYEAAINGTSGSNIAWNSAGGQKKLIYTIRQFMNDTGYSVPGHRNTFLTRNGNKIGYGMTNYTVCQTVEYTDNPNPQGTAVLDNNEAAYAWPAAGYFPAEDLSTSAYWTVNLNTDKLSLSNQALTVTITDLDTGDVFTRASSADGLYASSYWGKFICFAPPTVTTKDYAGKRYKVVLENLEDGSAMPATLEYTIEFFSYSDEVYTKDGIDYVVDKYGELSEETDSSESGGNTGGETGGESGGSTGGETGGESGGSTGGESGGSSGGESGETTSSGNWVSENGNWYYVDDSGNRATGWQQIDGEWYYMNSNGAMQTGWLNDNGTWYYLKSDGSMATSTWIGSEYVDASGVWVSGGNSGSSTYTEGWQLSGGLWWYQNADGSYPVNAWKAVGGAWYYFDASGWMKTGWVNDGSGWYYMNPSGAMATGWINDGGLWYYLAGSGLMKTGWLYDAGAWYYLVGSGAMTTGWLNDNGTWYYFVGSGAMAVNTTIDGYTIDSNGAMVE